MLTTLRVVQIKVIWVFGLQPWDTANLRYHDYAMLDWQQKGMTCRLIIMSWSGYSVDHIRVCLNKKMVCKTHCKYRWTKRVHEIVEYTTRTSTTQTVCAGHL